LMADNRNAPYMTSKHAVVALTEHLYHWLRQENARVGVSVLCPNFVQSDFATSDRNRPAALRSSRDGRQILTVVERSPNLRQSIATGMPAAQVADLTFAGIRGGQLYILTHPEADLAIRRRIDGLLAALERSQA
jgi:short-subunit dehydrogenase